MSDWMARLFQLVVGTGVIGLVMAMLSAPAPRAPPAPKQRRPLPPTTDPRVSAIDLHAALAEAEATIFTEAAAAARRPF